MPKKRKTHNNLPTTTLPNDVLVTEILLKLPARSLVRFKCLSKFFLGHISSPEFCECHLGQALSSDTNRLLIYATHKANHQRVLYALDLDSPESHAFSIPLPEFFSRKNNYVRIIGSCNGLLCLYFSSASFGKVHFIFMNPSTGFSTSVTSTEPTSCSLSSTYGFGYDHVKDEYKLVIVYCYSDHPPNTRVVLIYSLRAKSWKYVEKMAHSNSSISCHPALSGVLIDDKLLHWKFCCPIDKRHRIGCFNLENEQWADDVPLPVYKDDCWSCSATQYTKLGVIDGSLCLSNKVEGNSNIDVWIMKEYGVKESWVKLFSTTLMLFTPPLAYRRGTQGEVLLTKLGYPEQDGAACHWYNIRDKKLEAGLPIDVIMDLTVSIGSLVTVFGGCGIEYRRNA